MWPLLSFGTQVHRECRPAVRMRYGGFERESEIGVATGARVIRTSAFA